MNRADFADGKAPASRRVIDLRSEAHAHGSISSNVESDFLPRQRQAESARFGVSLLQSPKLKEAFPPLICGQPMKRFQFARGTDFRSHQGEIVGAFELFHIDPAAFRRAHEQRDQTFAVRETELKSGKSRGRNEEGLLMSVGTKRPLVRRDRKDRGKTEPDQGAGKDSIVLQLRCTSLRDACALLAPQNLLGKNRCFRGRGLLRTREEDFRAVDGQMLQANAATTGGAEHRAALAERRNFCRQLSHDLPKANTSGFFHIVT